MESVLGMTFWALDYGEPVNVFNVYGPYLNMISFWDNLFNNYVLKGDMVIIRGYLNFSLGLAEVLGPHARSDLMMEYFTHKLVGRN